MSAREPSGSTLHFVHASDSHVRSAREWLPADLARLEGFVERVRTLRERGVPIDFVVHTGDLVDDADEPEASSEATRAALAVLDGLPVRWFLLNGNHDRRAFLVGGASDAGGRRPSGHGDVPVTDGTGVAVRRLGDRQLVFVDANPERGGAADLRGVVSAEAVATVARRIDEHAGRSVIFLHYPPLAQEAPWTGACDGGEALHAALVPRAGRLHGVFVGHNHRSIHHLRDGVLYAIAPALTWQALLWPGQERFSKDEEPVAGLHYVTLDADGSTRVQQHAFVRPRDDPS